MFCRSSASGSYLSVSLLDLERMGRVPGQRPASSRKTFVVKDDKVSNQDRCGWCHYPSFRPWWVHIWCHHLVIRLLVEGRQEVIGEWFYILIYYATVEYSALLIWMYCILIIPSIYTDLYIDLWVYATLTPNIWASIIISCGKGRNRPPSQRPGNQTFTRTGLKYYRNLLSPI